MNIERSTSNVQLSRGSRESRIQKLESTSQELDRWFLSGEDGPQKRVFLRNELELKTWNCERIFQGANELGRARKLFNSGSFGAEMTDSRVTSAGTKEESALIARGYSSAYDIRRHPTLLSEILV
jgi:hypothetical protein